MSVLSTNHYTVPSYRQTVTTKELQAIIDQSGTTCIRRGTLVHMKQRRVAPGRYEIWYVDDDPTAPCAFCGRKASS